MLILKFLLSYSIYFLFNGKQKYSLSNKMFSCKISRFHPIKNIKKLDVISLKNNITKTLVPLCDSFNSSFNGSFYLRLKNINYYNGKY